MTGTRTLIAFHDPNSGQLILLPYILDTTVKLQKCPLDLHVITSSAALYGGRMATIHNGATIQIYATVKLSPNKIELHFTWNRGLYVQGYSPTFHPTAVNDLASTTTIDILSGATAKTQSSMRPLKIVHGAINAISWGFLLPLGAVGARYLRHPIR